MKHSPVDALPLPLVLVAFGVVTFLYLRTRAALRDAVGQKTLAHFALARAFADLERLRAAKEGSK